MTELEEIKQKIDIADYIGKYVQLKQSGRNFKACCPFHNEKTPSFYVSGERQIWRCFGACGEGGDIFAFVQKMDGLTFPEAVRILADKTGVKLKKQESFEKSDKKNRIFAANEVAQDYYHENLFKPVGASALKYLKGRGLTDKTIKDFKLGYADGSRNDLMFELKKHGYSPKELESMGLAGLKRGELKDFFFKRLIFPIRDITGRPVAFAGRVLDDSLPKYINTPGNEIYEKSNVVFGIDLAKDSMRKADNAIIVEGYMDMIASYQEGVKNVVAPCGTALTEGQLKLVGRMTKNVKFAFDVDFAGSEATRRAIEVAWGLGYNIKVIEVPAGKDPADAVAEDPKIWKESVKDSVYVVDYLFAAAFKKYKKEEALGKKMIARDLLPVLKRIPDEIEKDSYIKKLAEGLGVSEDSVRDTLHKISLPKEKQPKTPEPVKEKRPVNKKSELEKNIIGLLVLFPHYLDFASMTLAGEDFMLPQARQCFSLMLKYYNENGEFSEGKFLGSLDKEQRELFDHFVLSAESTFEDFDDEKKAEEIYFGIKRLKKLSLEEKKKALSEKVAHFEKTGNKAEAKEALESLQLLIEEERRIS